MGGVKGTMLWWWCYCDDSDELDQVSKLCETGSFLLLLLSIKSYCSALNFIGSKDQKCNNTIKDGDLPPQYRFVWPAKTSA